MKISDRSFGGKLFRPTPETHFEPDGSLCLVSTPWGHRGSGKKLNQSIVDFFHSAATDKEVTSPFQKLTCLSPQGNHLRTAIMLANDLIYREDNSGEYVSGIELFAAALHNQEFTWASVGQPHVLLVRGGLLYLLSVSADATIDSLINQGGSVPLPHNMLGTYSTSNFGINSVKVIESDKILLISRATLPLALFQLPKGTQNLESVSLALAKDDEATPFWLGLLTF